jgi:uncharacterized protein YehS (DUF1456 family)
VNYLRLGIILTNNDILLQISHTFNLTNDAIAEIFALENMKVSDETVAGWLSNTTSSSELQLELDQEPSHELQPDLKSAITDIELATFLNGFITLKRGKRENGQAPVKNIMNNNLVLMKLRIALDLKAEDLVELFEKVDLPLSKHEISAFFRKPNNKHYRVCKDVTLQKFFESVAV